MLFTVQQHFLLNLPSKPAQLTSAKNEELETSDLQRRTRAVRRKTMRLAVTTA